MCDFGYLKISYRSDLNKVAQRIVLFQGAQGDWAGSQFMLETKIYSYNPGKLNLTTFSKSG